MLAGGLTKVFAPFAPAILAAMASTGYKPPPGKLGRTAVLAARGAQAASRLQLAIGAMLVARSSVAASEGALVAMSAGDAEVAEIDTTQALHFTTALVAVAVVAAVTRTQWMGVLWNWILFILTKIIALMGIEVTVSALHFEVSFCPRRNDPPVVPPPPPPPVQLPAPVPPGHVFLEPEPQLLEHPGEQNPVRAYRHRVRVPTALPPRAGDEAPRCRYRCNMHQYRLALPDQCHAQCHLDAGHEVPMPWMNGEGTHSCVDCARFPRFHRGVPGDRRRRDVATQSQTSYTSVRGNVQPRFVPHQNFTGSVEPGLTYILPEPQRG
jgi:hypothetical protein